MISLTSFVSVETKRTEPTIKYTAAAEGSVCVMTEI